MNTCVGCGITIPEGTQVCPICVNAAVRAAGNKIREHLRGKPIRRNKVKIIYARDEYMLEDRINDFIQDKALHDIQYQASPKWPSAMIIYEEVN